CDTKERQESNRIKEGFQLWIKLWEDGKKPEEVCLKHPYGHIACLYKLDGPIEKLDPIPPRGCTTPTIHKRLCHLTKEGCRQCECCDCVVLGVIHVGEKREDHEYGQKQEQRYPTQQEATP